MRISDWSSDVCSSDLNSGEPAIGKSIDTADEGIDTRSILMVHLVGFTRLCQGVSLVDQQDHATTCSTFGRLEFAGFIERRSEERRVGKACVSKCRSRWSPSL